MFLGYSELLKLYDRAYLFREMTRIVELEQLLVQDRFARMGLDCPTRQRFIMHPAGKKHPALQMAGHCRISAQVLWDAVCSITGVNFTEWRFCIQRLRDVHRPDALVGFASTVDAQGMHAGEVVYFSLRETYRSGFVSWRCMRQDLTAVVLEHLFSDIVFRQGALFLPVSVLLDRGDSYGSFFVPLLEAIRKGTDALRADQASGTVPADQAYTLDLLELSMEELPWWKK